MEDFQKTTVQPKPGVSILAVILFFIIFVPTAFSLDINKVSLYLLIPILFLYSVTKNPKLIINYKPIFYLLILYFWSLITIIMSVDMALSLRQIRQITGVFLLCYIIIRFCFVNPKYIYIFYLLYIIRFIYIFYYAQQHDLFVPTERFNIDELNANEFGYFGFFSIISAFTIWQSVKNNLLKLFLFLFFVLCLALSVIACFYAASRAGMIMSILTAAFLVFIHYFYPLSKKTFYGSILLIIIAMTVVPIMTYYYHGSILETRFQIESLEDESRYGLMLLALEAGFKNPIFGVGPGNFILYSGVYAGFSHCSYTELLANNGLVALGLFISILYYFYNKNRKLYSLGNNSRKNAMFFYGFIFFYCLYNFFYVFYLNLFMMGFLYLGLAHLETSISTEEKQEL